MSQLGRPEILDEQRKNTVCNYVRAGCSVRRAARYAGLDESTIRKAAVRDADFGKQLAEAAAKWETDCLARIVGDSSWRAAAWLLEKTIPDEYGRKSGPKNDPHNNLAAALNRLIDSAEPHSTSDPYARLEARRPAAIENQS